MCHFQPKKHPQLLLFIPRIFGKITPLDFGTFCRSLGPSWNPNHIEGNGIWDRTCPGFRRFATLATHVWIGWSRSFTIFQARVLSSCKGKPIIFFPNGGTDFQERCTSLADVGLRYYYNSLTGENTEVPPRCAVSATAPLAAAPSPAPAATSPPVPQASPARAVRPSRCQGWELTLLKLHVD